MFILTVIRNAQSYMLGLLFQVVILSDTFYEFAQPLMRQLGFPTLLCHKLETDGNGRVTNYRLRQANPKRQAIVGFWRSVSCLRPCAN